MDPREKEWECVDWVHLSLYRDLWWALVNMGIKVGVP